MVYKMGRKWPNTSSFVGFCFQYLLKTKPAFFKTAAVSVLLYGCTHLDSYDFEGKVDYNSSNHFYIIIVICLHTILFSLVFAIQLFKVLSSGCNTLVPFQQLLEGSMEVLLCEHVNDLRHRLFHLLNSQLRELPKVTASKVWNIGKVKNSLSAHLGQIVCDKDGVVDWCIVLVEMPLTRFVLASSGEISF